METQDVYLPMKYIKHLERLSGPFNEDDEQQHEEDLRDQTSMEEWLHIITKFLNIGFNEAKCTFMYVKFLLF